MQQSPPSSPFKNPPSTPSSSVSGGNGNGNGGNISDAQPAELMLIPPGRNPLEPSSSALPASAYPSLDPPAPYQDIHSQIPPRLVPQINNRTHELLDMLFRMNEEQLREYAKNNVGLKPRGNTSKDTLIGNIVIAQLGPPSAPPMDLLKKEIKRRRRIDTPIPQSPPNY